MLKAIRIAPAWLAPFNAISAYAHGWAAAVVQDKRVAEWLDDVCIAQTITASFLAFACVPIVIAAWENRHRE